MPVYTIDLEDSDTSGVWEIAPNNMDAKPLWGLAGFGNFFNNYTWTMEVYEDTLYVGTMDWSYLLDDGYGPLLEFLFTSQQIPQPDIEIQFPASIFGADLFGFPSSNSPAFPESINGVGNFTNYGIRTMISDDALYLGMANPMNLLTDPTDDLPEGGWELLKLSQSPHQSKVHQQGAQHTRKYTLYQNHPNPFNPATTIDYDLPKPSHLRLTICDLLGRHIRTLVDSQQKAGHFHINWDGKNEFGVPVSAGVYLCRMVSKDFVMVTKLVLVKKIILDYEECLS